jgi:hypothetical protein
MGFMSGQKIYENFTNGVGPEGLSSSAVMVNELAAEYLEEGDAIRRLTAKMESVWQGDAAGAAQRGAGPLAAEHELAAPQMGTAQDLNSRQAGSFVDARNAVVPVPAQPAAPNPWAVFTSPGEVVPYRQQVADYNAANQHNVDVMTGYAGASSYNGKGMPQSYGTLTDDQSGIAIDAGGSDAGGPRDSGPESDDGSRAGGRGAVERPARGVGWVAPPSDAAGPASSGGAPPEGGGRPGPQETTPGGFAPAPTGPVGPVGGGVESRPPSGGPGGGSAPGTGFVPVGSGLNDGSGGRGLAARGPLGRVGGGEPHGPGGRLGAGQGGVSGEPHVAARGTGGAAGRGGVSGGVPVAGGGRGRGEEDLERFAPDYLQEQDPEGVFGADELTAPPVIGEDLETPSPAE